MNRETRAYKRQLEITYEKKIRHYEKDQEKLISDKTPVIADDLRGTVVEHYIDTINGINEMEQEDPLPPMICWNDIKLSASEKAVLARGPKFSVRGNLNKEDLIMTQ